LKPEKTAAERSGRLLVVERAMKIAVLYGGVGPEREVSLASGEAVLEACDRLGWEVLPVEITPEGRFSVRGLALEPTEAIGRMKAEAVEAVFPALHGPVGEDGLIQGFLEVVGLPYAGSGVESCALAMNKHASRLIFTAAGMQVPPGRRVQSKEELKELPLPAVVKPCRLGSSVGVKVVHGREDLEKAVSSVWEMGQECLVERFIEGVEFSCPVWQRQGCVEPLPVIEIRPAGDRPFFDYEAKYSPQGAEEIVRLEYDPLLEELKELAARAHRQLGCRDFSRTDFVVHPAQGPFVLELNTIPGMTRASLLPKALGAVGFSLADLVRESIEQAVSRTRSRCQPARPTA